MARTKIPHLVSLLAAFVAVSVGLGLIGAGLMMPLAGAGGSAARATVDGFNNLDDEWTANPLAQQSKIYSADNKLLATPYTSRREVVPLNKINENMIQAQMAIEDSRFREHGGIDVRGTSRAFFQNLQSDSTQGGSSITQQYVKIMLQERAVREGDSDAAEAAVEQTYSRKLQELKYALNIEKTQTKDQILSSYLNLVNYSDNTYGVEAAAKRFFNKHASELTLTESATLAGVVQSPGRYNIRTNPEEVQERRDVVLDRMLSLGWITQAEADEAKEPSVESLVDIQEDEGGTCSKASDPYFCNYVIEYLKTMPELGENPDERMQAVNTGGLRINTTLRRNWQQKMEQELKERVPTSDSGVGAAGAMIEPGTGKVRAIAQTSEYKIGLQDATSQYSEQSWSVPFGYGGTNGFAIGSTAKPFNLVTAVQEGMTADSTVYAQPTSSTSPAVFYTNDFQRGCTTVDPWPVRNAGDSSGGGAMTLAQATKGSVNTAFAQLASEVGSCKIADNMEKMGLRTGNGEKYGLAGSDDNYAISNLVLGSDSSTPLQLASAYATLAADGKYCAPTPIQSITTADGTKIKLNERDCEQVLTTDTARKVTHMMFGALEPGGTAGSNPSSALADGREAAGKTGTTDDSNQSWFGGFTPQLSTAIWVGTPIDTFPMRNINIGGQFYADVYGGSIAAPIWKQTMDYASRDMETVDFPDVGEDTDG
ncbi:transglycosylase domain-containing protein [Janibacter alkaliphilus]|uniref:Membrane peptidoglycan carboxypeptidase n=1 Tax=Janibacter alkaliphilus TaxID=1069963 RepID=A0A852X6Z2_9MICO|nr:transglycosylase domain-containing protein [Janibacter alkaliphilus]NYG36024.1 membrane peptidoglycan carboxypeptidase [Janibacter alkaliphilus]